MPDLGDPTSYLELPAGVPVFSADGAEVGTVAHVLADAESDIFDGLVIDTSRGPGGHRFADAQLIDRLHVRGVVLTVDAAGAAALPEPSENPAVVDPGNDEPGAGGKLRRAWDRISGNY